MKGNSDEDFSSQSLGFLVAFGNYWMNVSARENSGL